MLDPITLISLLTLQTPTRISIAAQGEKWREGMSLCCFIFLSSCHALEKGYIHCKSWKGVGVWDAPTLQMRCHTGQWHPGPHWCPTHSIRPALLELAKPQYGLVLSMKNASLQTALLL